MSLFVAFHFEFLNLPGHQLYLKYLLPNFYAVICWQLVSRFPSSIGIGYDCQ